MRNQRVSAIIVVRNAVDALANCLNGVRWCDEVIAVDMGSTDGSDRLAAQRVDRLYRGSRLSSPEPLIIEAAKRATHDWVLWIEPEEVPGPLLGETVHEALSREPDAAGLRLAVRHHHRGQPIHVSAWSQSVWEMRLFHRERCTLQPVPGRLAEFDDAARVIDLPDSEDRCLRRELHPSHRSLMRECIGPRAREEARGDAQRDEHPPVWERITRPFREARRTLLETGGWRSRHGMKLSIIHIAHACAVEYHRLRFMLYPAKRFRPSQQMCPRIDELPTRRRPHLPLPDRRRVVRPTLWDQLFDLPLNDPNAPREPGLAPVGVPAGMGAPVGVGV